MAGFFVAGGERKSTAAWLIIDRTGVAISVVGGAVGRLIVNRAGGGIIGGLVIHGPLIIGLRVIGDRPRVVGGPAIASPADVDIDPGSRLGGGNGKQAQGESGQGSQGERFKIFHMDYDGGGGIRIQNFLGPSGGGRIELPPRLVGRVSGGSSAPAGCNRPGDCSGPDPCYSNTHCSGNNWGRTYTRVDKQPDVHNRAVPDNKQGGWSSPCQC